MTLEEEVEQLMPAFIDYEIDETVVEAGEDSVEGVDIVLMDVDEEYRVNIAETNNLGTERMLPSVLMRAVDAAIERNARDT